MASKEITIRDKVFEEYISKEELNSAIEQVAMKMNEEFENCEEPPVFLITLSGGTFFAVDLMKKLTFFPKIGFVKCSSYGDGMSSSGKVKMQIEPTIDIKGKHVIIIEDLVDTGLTCKQLQEHLLSSGAAKVQIAAMLFKRDSCKENITVDWFALGAESKFLLGMGMDYGEVGRNIPSIYILKQTT